MTFPIHSFVAADHRLRSRDVILALAAFAVLIALRLPIAWIEGRFLDEEVTVFFAYAWNFGPWEALFRPFAGYWNVAANGSTLLLAEAVRADWISLERAPYVTMILGLSAQLLPMLLLLTGKAEWLRDRSTRLIACALLLLVPAVDEVYLNVLHIQLHLALCVGLILALDVPESRSLKWLSAAILVVAPLCGPGAIVFLPLFACRAFLERDRGRLLQLLILGGGAAIQMLFFYSSSPARGLPLEPVVFAAAMFVRLVILPLLGPVIACNTGHLSYVASMTGNPLALYALAFAALVSFAALAWWSLRARDGAPWLVASAFLVGGVSLGFGAAGHTEYAGYQAVVALSSPRYNYIPLSLLALAVLILARRPENPGRKIGNILLTSYAIVGVVFFTIGIPGYTRGVSWPAEVATWRADPSYQPRAWPEGVRADLSGKRHDCPQPVVKPGNPEDPRYCESGWLSGFYSQGKLEDVQ